ncbi:MAG TPA: hypothetical protein PLE70_04670 [Methanolinea sp.]|nr:hypothetical protein [Methanolinea sp.]
MRDSAMKGPGEWIIREVNAFFPLTHETATLSTRVFLTNKPVSRRHGIDPGQSLPFAREYTSIS